MRHLLAALTPVVLVGGCSLIYNPSNLSSAPIDASDAPLGVDAEMTADAEIDAQIIADANPALLALEKLAPAQLLEGQGVGGARPALLVIKGMHISLDATVAVTPVDDLTVGTPVVSANRDYMLVPISVALNTTKSSETVALTVTVSQNGASPQELTDKLELKYLPEWTAGSSINGASLAPLYSEVTATNVTFIGTVPVKIRAVSSINFGNITASGARGNGTTPGVAGPGGCVGGVRGGNGGCSGFVGGGLGGSGTNGGGGGGFGEDGTAAAGAAGTGGAQHGQPQVVLYTDAAANTNRSGGGGGGGSSGASAGGVGGGGGGTIELTAGGNIVVGDINVNGGDGDDATAGLTGGGGGGGGGSGGLIVIRTVAGTVTAGALTAVGGAAGAAAGSLVGGGGGGGAGGRGRIRIDAPSGALPAADPSAVRGTSFAAATPTYVTALKPTITLLGTTGHIVDGYIVDGDGALRLGEPIDETFAATSHDVIPTMIPGYNKLCFTVEPGVRPSLALPAMNELADSCIEIAYLP